MAVQSPKLQVSKSVRVKSLWDPMSDNPKNLHLSSESNTRMHNKELDIGINSKLHISKISFQSS